MALALTSRWQLLWLRCCGLRGFTATRWQLLWLCCCGLCDAMASALRTLWLHSDTMASGRRKVFVRGICEKPFFLECCWRRGRDLLKDSRPTIYCKKTNYLLRDRQKVFFCCKWELIEKTTGKSKHSRSLVCSAEGWPAHLSHPKYERKKEARTLGRVSFCVPRHKPQEASGKYLYK